jgi:ASCH domain
VKALTVKQPWAWAIAYGSKRVENRTWMPPSSLRELAIHAGARSSWDRDGEASPLVWREWKRLGHLAAHLDRKSEWIDFGAIVAIAELADCHDGTLEQGECSDWADRRLYHWVLANIRPLAEPVPARGMLGLWTVPEEAERAVRAQLGENR